jgi:hypothetical protein
MKAPTGTKLAAAIAGLFFISVIISIPMGCKTSLAPGGVYKGDTFLFNADLTIGDSGKALDEFVTWEMQNRSRLTNKLHAVTVAADAIRINAPMWFTNAVTARNTYSNAVALARGAGTITTASNALGASVTQLQTQTLSTRALVNSVNP